MTNQSRHFHVGITDRYPLDNSIVVHPDTPLWNFIREECSDALQQPLPKAARQAWKAFQKAQQETKRPKTFSGDTEEVWRKRLEVAWLNGAISGEDFDVVNHPVFEADWTAFREHYLEHGTVPELTYKLKFAVTVPKGYEGLDGDAFYVFEFDKDGVEIWASAPNFISELFGASALADEDQVFELLNKLAELPDSAWSEKALTLRAARSWVKTQEETLHHLIDAEEARS